MQPIAEMFWRLLPAVRASERSRSLFFGSLLTLISAAQTLGLAGSEALFLARFGTDQLPEMFVVASLVTVLGTVAYGSWVGRARNDTLFVQSLIGAGCLLVMTAYGIPRGQDWLVPASFCFFYLTSAIFVNHFWTFSGDYFDTITSKRLFPAFTIGASIGGCLGGVAAVGLTPIYGAAGLIWGWALLLLAAALLLRAAHRPLRRWGPLDLEEADETSVEGLRGAALFLRKSRLGRWLVLSSAGMVFAIFLAQYLYSQIFAREYPDPAQLAAFFGLYLACTNLLEIVIVAFVTPWMIQRFGVPTAQVFHPVLTLASFAGLAISSGFVAGIGARMNRELIENAIAQPVRALVYNALPQRLRGRIRAFLEGIVVYAGMAIAGFVLIVLDTPDARLLAAIGIIASIAYLIASWRVRASYLNELVSGIRTGRIELDQLDEDIGELDIQQLVQLCKQWLEDEAQRPSRSLLRLIASLGRRGIAEPLMSGASHPHVSVRRASLDALARIDGREIDQTFLQALDDDSPEVRKMALTTMRDVRKIAGVETACRALMQDEDARVRALAATWEDDEHLPTLRQMLDQDESDIDALCAALPVAPVRLTESIIRRSEHPNARVRAVALKRAGELEIDRIEAPALEAALDDPEIIVRIAALRFVAHTHPTLRARIAEALADRSTRVRRAAVAALIENGSAGAELALPFIRHGSEVAARAAIRVVAQAAESRRRHEVLRSELRYRAEQMWECVLALQEVQPGRDLARDFLRAAISDAQIAHQRVAFALLEQLENPRIIRRVERALQAAPGRVRSDALEVLSNLGDRTAAQLLVLIHENSPLDERLSAVEPWVRIPSDREGLLQLAASSAQPWIRGAAAAIDGRLDESPIEDSIMERLLALKQVPLFANLTLDQLDAVGQRTEELDFVADEIVVREGDQGDELFILLEGRVEVILDRGTPTERHLGEMSAVDYFGEMAIIDREPRSASIVAREPARLLSLDGHSLRDLIQQMPEISLELMGVLSARVRRAEALLRSREDT